MRRTGGANANALVAIDNSVIARKVVALASIQALALQAQVVVVCCIDTGYACGPLEIKAGEDLVDCELTRMSKIRPKR